MSKHLKISISTAILVVIAIVFGAIVLSSCNTSTRWGCTGSKYQTRVKTGPYGWGS